MYIYIHIHIHIYISHYTYIHAYTSSCAWHAQISSLEVLGRGTLATYALKSAEAGLVGNQPLAYPCVSLCDAPLFALVMAAALRDAGALCAACTSKNRCQKPRLSLRSIFWNKSRNQEEFFLIILAFYRLQRPLTRPVPSWAILPVIKQEDDVQRTDSALKNPTPSPHRPVLIPSKTGALRFRLSVKKTKEDHEDDAHCTDSARKNPTPLLRHTDGNGLCTSWSMPVYRTFPTIESFLFVK
jgi:hypothetical protein